MLLHADYFRQIFDVSNLTLHDNMCLWPGWLVGRLDVTLITVGCRNLLATGRDDCRGHCHTQSEVRLEGVSVCVCVCTVRPSHHWPSCWVEDYFKGSF